MITAEEVKEKKLWRDEKHDHFWIEDGVLFESYNTIRGMRYRYRLAVFGVRDSDRLSDIEIEQIEKEFVK